MLGERVTEKQLDHWARLAKKVPGPPWAVDTSEEGALLVRIPGSGALYMGDMSETDAADHDLADFLAAAPEAVPAMIAEIHRLRAALEAAHAD